MAPRSQRVVSPPPPPPATPPASAAASLPLLFTSCTGSARANRSHRAPVATLHVTFSARRVDLGTSLPVGFSSCRRTMNGESAPGNVRLARTRTSCACKGAVARAEPFRLQEVQRRADRSTSGSSVSLRPFLDSPARLHVKARPPSGRPAFATQVVLVCSHRRQLCLSDVSRPRVPAFPVSSLELPLPPHRSQSRSSPSLLSQPMS